LKSLYSPGDTAVGHAFAYLPDLAETTARLLDREEDLERFDVFHFAGHWLERWEELADAMRRVSGRPGLPMRPFPWIMVRALSPFIEMFRELLEMRYLWRKPIGLDDAKLRAFLGEVPSTPLDTAMRASLTDMGCLPEAIPGVGRLVTA
jgi:nucleoside-diphosphate-sugar epimerase